jgi:hypothetical protein
MKGPHRDDNGKIIKRKPRRSASQKAMVDKSKDKQRLAALERLRGKGVIV